MSNLSTVSVFTLGPRESALRRPSTTLWALGMTVVLVVEVVTPSAGATWVGFGLCALYGAQAGWRNRLGAVLWAPLANWMVAALPLVVASMVHDGVLRGFFSGVVLVTFGWIGIAAAEVMWMGLVAVTVRALRPRREPSVTLFGPDGQEH